MEKFIVKHYSSDDRPSIKGYGFDGLEVGEDRAEAEEFIDFINSILAECKKRGIRVGRGTPGVAASFGPAAAVGGMPVQPGASMCVSCAEVHPPSVPCHLATKPCRDCQTPIQPHDRYAFVEFVAEGEHRTVGPLCGSCKDERVMSQAVKFF